MHKAWSNVQHKDWCIGVGGGGGVQFRTWISSHCSYQAYIEMYHIKMDMLMSNNNEQKGSAYYFPSWYGVTLLHTLFTHSSTHSFTI